MNNLFSGSAEIQLGSRKIQTVEVASKHSPKSGVLSFIKVFLLLSSPLPPPLFIFVSVSASHPLMSFPLLRNLSGQKQKLLRYLAETQDRSHSEIPPVWEYSYAAFFSYQTLVLGPRILKGPGKETLCKNRTEQHRTRTCSLTQGAEDCHPCNQNIKQAGFTVFFPYLLTAFLKT